MTESSTTATRPAGGGILHPAALAGLCLLALNDHVLKAAFPGVVTGKLSDVAGMVFFPFLLQALLEFGGVVVGRYRGASLRLAIGAAILTGVFFTFVKTTDVGGEVYRWLWSTMRWAPDALLALMSNAPVPLRLGVKHIVDPSDVVAVPCVVAVVWAERRRCRCRQPAPRPRPSASWPGPISPGPANVRPQQVACGACVACCRWWSSAFAAHAPITSTALLNPCRVHGDDLKRSLK